MKVFDFTDGKKGKLLGETKQPERTGGWYVTKNDNTFKVRLANPRNVKPIAGVNAGVKWEWRSDATSSNGDDLKPEDFGVAAICFCTGEYYVTWHKNHPKAESEWWWNVLGTTDWNRSACKSGVLKATKITREGSN